MTALGKGWEDFSQGFLHSSLFYSFQSPLKQSYRYLSVLEHERDPYGGESHLTTPPPRSKIDCYVNVHTRGIRSSVRKEISFINKTYKPDFRLYKKKTPKNSVFFFLLAKCIKHHIPHNMAALQSTPSFDCASAKSLGSINGWSGERLQTGMAYEKHRS